MNKIYMEKSMKDKNITIDKILETCESTLISKPIYQTTKTFCCDTRILKKGDMFISLKTETNSGIKYIEEAFKKGAIGCITEYDIPQEILEKNNDKIIIKVKDVIQSIQDLAKYKRSLFDIPIVAITGSVGKTTTKDMISNVLMQKYNVAKTQGNYNNHIGVPITILNWNESTEAAVVEMGMNHFGEISLLTNIVKPTIAVITNIGTAHIGILRLSRKYIKSKARNIRGIK